MLSATSDSLTRPDPNDVRGAAERLSGLVHRTPLIRSRTLDQIAGLELFLKCENLQRTGSFKIRGALNAILQLPSERRSRGVVAFSSGNHAQAVALAARLNGISATIVMPEDSVAAKVVATEGYGARVVREGVTAANRRQIAEQIAAETGATILPPFDHPHIIAGAGTVIREALEQCPEARTIVVPLGGGGLLAGSALAARAVDPSLAVWGVEPRLGDDGRRSLEEGRIVSIDPPPTIADGARTTAIGTLNFEIVREHVRGIVTVTDDEILETLALVMQRTKLLIEPTGALGLSAILHARIPDASGPVIVVLSGGNLDFSLFDRLR